MSASCPVEEVRERSTPLRGGPDDRPDEFGCVTLAGLPSNPTTLPGAPFDLVLYLFRVYLPGRQRMAAISQGVEGSPQRKEQCSGPISCGQSGPDSGRLSPTVLSRILGSTDLSTLSADEEGIKKILSASDRVGSTGENSELTTTRRTKQGRREVKAQRTPKSANSEEEAPTTAEKEQICSVRTDEILLESEQS
ncbi:hypothetical protein BIW11_13997 [Tropilaelaps mercedesae]|uniref:Uncharacterized protein n=1 Tax=Tropilaelaps mercedesae TaxID=418985 RepID=A0A1V9WZS9_9ACAR|nr:hypothetical protein BIW11_13997 [Tropilaelaps mercedesae]